MFFVFLLFIYYLFIYLFKFFYILFVCFDLSIYILLQVIVSE